MAAVQRNIGSIQTGAAADRERLVLVHAELGADALKERLGKLVHAAANFACHRFCDAAVENPFGFAHSRKRTHRAGGAELFERLVFEIAFIDESLSYIEIEVRAEEHLLKAPV